ncbi:hypothetical protein HMI55_006563 [Coelomomyces lativittatus]|nr:hypothetical protein HMI55_006563 [Coelomomyces lativittatus]
MKILFTSSPPEPPYLRRESKYPHLSVNESKRLSDPQQPFQPNAIEGYIPTPTVFTLLVIVFEKLITQRTKSYVKQNSSVTNPLPCTLQTKVIIHTTEENMNLKDEEPNADGEFADVVPVETDLFFSQLRKISQKVLSFLPTTEPYTFFTHLEQLSQTFQCVDKAVHLLISHNIYSWIFVLVCLWGTCQCSSELKSSVIDSGALKNVLEQILLPVARNTGLCINHDIVEKIGEMVFY